MKRIFIGIPLNSEFKSICNNFTSEQNIPGIKWTKSENHHITTLFIGNFPSAHVNSLRDYLLNSFEQINPFDIEFEGFFYTPNINNPKMIWGKFSPNEDFEKLIRKQYNSVKHFCKLSKIPFSIKIRDKNIPHITLSRIKSNRRHYPQLIQPKIVKSKFQVQSCRLTQSILKPEGAEYNMIYEYEFIK